MNKRATAWTMMLLLLALTASSASAATCRKKITTFLGFENPNGQPDCYTLVGPPIAIVEIGQIIRECDDTSWSWGRTDCTHPDGITVVYEDCDNCQASLQVHPSEEPAESCDARVTETEAK